MNVDFEQAIRYPFEDDDWIKTVGIGGGLALIPGIVWVLSMIISFIPFVNLLNLILYPVGFLLSIVIGMPIMGYFVSVLRTTIRGDTRPPVFDDWEQLFRDGFYGYVLGIAYFVPLMIIGGLGLVALVVVLVLAGSAGGDSGGSAALFVFGYFGFLGLTLLYSFGVAYVFPISLATYAHEGDLRAAFSRERLKTVGLDKRYAIVWVIAYFGLQAVNSFVSFTIFLLIGFFIQFLLAIVYWRLLGLGYADAMDLRDDWSDPSAGFDDDDDVVVEDDDSPDVDVA